ncbi:MAG: histidinol-phosphate transaminase [Cyclobacteriaceae bacterium]
MALLKNLIRTHLQEVTAYSSARDEFEGEAEVYLDANENALGSTTAEQYHRYPDPHHTALKKKWAELRGVDENRIFFGNGSDEPIDLLIRLFCEPHKDHIITMPPTYGMYKVSAKVNAVDNVEVPLTPRFQVDYNELKEHWNGSSKILFLCSPNNPTGNALKKENIINILKNFPGIVVIDEAYIDFSIDQSWVSELENYPKLVILQTLSKSWGMAGIRVGVAMGDPFVIAMLEKIKPPYNISQVNQQLALEALQNEQEMKARVGTLLVERDRMLQDLNGIAQVEKIHVSHGNFLLVRMKDAEEVFHYLTQHGVIVRNRTKELHCQGCLRITVGTKEENDRLINLLTGY